MLRRVQVLRLLRCVEGYYIHTLRPPRNEQYRTPHEWALPYINAKTTL